MEKYDKSILMLYRGKDDSNKVSSATKMALDKDKCIKYIDFDVMNLDKRNIEKYFLNSIKLPEIIYIWYDEEILIDYIVENYPSIELRIYDMVNSTEYKPNSYGRGKHIYIIAKTIIDEYKESQGTINLWISEKYNAKQVSIYTCDYELLDEWTKRKYFLTEVEAKKSIRKEIKEEIKRAEEMVEYYHNKIGDLKGLLK